MLGMVSKIRKSLKDCRAGFHISLGPTGMHEPRQAMDLKDAPSDMVMQLMLQSRLGVALMENLELAIGGEVAHVSWRTCWHPRVACSE